MSTSELIERRRNKRRRYRMRRKAAEKAFKQPIKDWVNANLQLLLDLCKITTPASELLVHVSNAFQYVPAFMLHGIPPARGIALYLLTYAGQYRIVNRKMEKPEQWVIKNYRRFRRKFNAIERPNNVENTDTISPCGAETTTP